MLLRIATAAVLIPIVVALVWWGPPALLAGLAALVAIACARWNFLILAIESACALSKGGPTSAPALIFYAQYSLGLVVHAFLCAGGFPLSATPRAERFPSKPCCSFLFLAVSLSGLTTRRSLHEVLPAVSISAAGLLFIALPFS